jgi:hypothetical protein
MLDSSQIPQAEKPDQVVALARHLHARDDHPIPAACEKLRNRYYYEHALQVLGALTDCKQPTQLLERLAGPDEAARDAFAQAFAASAVGQAWIDWQLGSSIADLAEADAFPFLVECSNLSSSTAFRRASTLRQWLRWCRGEPSVPAMAPDQLSLFSAPAPAPKPVAWPDVWTFPHNEGAHKVRQVLDGDLGAGAVLISVGYASLAEVIRFLSRRQLAFGLTRIMFGNEPFEPQRANLRASRRRLADEVRDFWLSRGVSIMLAADVLHATEALTNGLAQVRIAPPQRSHHAKLYVGEDAAILGSSNFTANGLGQQAEANARFTHEEPDRYAGLEAMAEGFWRQGLDYNQELLDLLAKLLKRVTWQEALARACAESWPTSSRTESASGCSTSSTTGPANAWPCLQPSR